MITVYSIMSLLIHCSKKGKPASLSALLTTSDAGLAAGLMPFYSPVSCGSRSPGSSSALSRLCWETQQTFWQPRVWICSTWRSWTTSCLWPPHTKVFLFWGLSCFCLSIAPAVTLNCTKAGELIHRHLRFLNGQTEV